MRKLKEKTASISCRVPIDMKKKFIEMSDILELSLAQYVALLVNIGEFGEAGLRILEEKLEDAYAEQKALKIELERYTNMLPFAKAPYASPLISVLQNDQILKELYGRYRQKLLPKAELVSLGFQLNTMLEAKFFDNTTYYCMGNFGWAYADEDRKTLRIRKV